MIEGIEASHDVPPAATPGKSGSFERIIGVLVSPGETFREIAARPDILVPLIVILVIAILTTIVMAPHIDVESPARAALESRDSKMSPEDIERAVRFAGAFAKAVMYAAPVVTAIFFAIVAGVLLIAFRLFGGEGDYKQAFSVTLYAWLPEVIKSILMAIIAMTRDGKIPGDEVGSLVVSHPGFFLDPKQHMVAYALLSSIDVFTIWTLVLFIIGFAYVSMMSRGKSAITVLSLWAVLLVFKLGFAALGAARMKQT